MSTLSPFSVMNARAIAFRLYLIWCAQLVSQDVQGQGQYNCNYPKTDHEDSLSGHRIQIQG